MKAAELKAALIDWFAVKLAEAYPGVSQDAARAWLTANYKAITDRWSDDLGRLADEAFGPPRSPG